MGTFTNKDRIEFYIDRSQVFNELNHCAKYSKACENMNEILISRAKDIMPGTDVWKLSSKLRPNILVSRNDLNDAQVEIIKSLAETLDEKEYWEKLYRFMTRKVMDEPISYYEYSMFTSFYEYGCKKFGVDTKHITFAV